MSTGTIWWSQLGNSLRLLSSITSELQDCRSFILQVPAPLPWRQSLYEAIDVRRSTFSGERRLMRLPWTEGSDPGAFVLAELCSEQTRAEYWPGRTYAEYLAALDDIVLNEYYVWITGIHKKNDLSQWTGFVSQYIRNAAPNDRHAVFILEYDGEQAELHELKRIVYSVESYDCRVFCLEAAAALSNAELRAYQAELALCIGGNDPELSGALLAQGDRLLHEPLSTAAEVMGSGVSSEGIAFSVRSEQQISSAAWKAAIVLLFPILEQYRLDFIARHALTLAQQLPISNSNGDRITDPYDLELGAIKYITSLSGQSYSEEERESIRLCRRVRNLLAHNSPVPYADVKAVLSL